MYCTHLCDAGFQVFAYLMPNAREGKGGGKKGKRSPTQRYSSNRLLKCGGPQEKAAPRTRGGPALL